MLDINIDALKLQEEEIECVKWASKDEIIDLIYKKQFAKCSEGLINFIFEQYYRKKEKCQ